MQLKLVLLQNLQSAVVRILDQLGDNRVHALGRTGGAGERRVLVEVRITRCPLRNGDLLTFGLSTFEFRG